MNGYQSPSVFRKQKETPKDHSTLGGSDHTNYTRLHRLHTTSSEEDITLEQFVGVLEGIGKRLC